LKQLYGSISVFFYSFANTEDGVHLLEMFQNEKQESNWRKLARDAIQSQFKN